MNEQQVLALITRVNSVTGTQYGVAKIPAHVHNGIDSNNINYTDLTGAPSSSATSGGQIDSGATSPILPTGWSVSLSGTIYTVTHNIGNTNYSVVFSVPSAVLNAVLQTRTASNFSVDFENSTGTAFSTNWDFVLSII